jgi:hypothetical protein
MGQIRVGRQDAFVRSVWLGHDQLAGTNVVGNLAHDQVVGAATTSHTGRFESINYFSPRMSGAQVTAGIMINEVETTSTAKTASGTQVGLNYAAGKFSAAAAQTSVKTTTAAVTGVTGTLYCGTTAQGTVTSNPASALAASCPTGTVYLAGSGYVAAAAAFDVKTKDTGAALSYDFGVVKVGYIYNDRDVNNGIQRESNSFSAAFPLTAKLTGRVGYGFGEYAATPTGQYQFFRELVNRSKKLSFASGVCYWEGTWVAYRGKTATDGSPWENQAWFDFNNKALPITKSFR